MCFSLDDLFKLDSYSMISLIEAVALPILPTTTPAAKLENSMALSKAIIKLQTSKTLRETYAKNAGKRIGRLYTHDIMRERTISIYKSLITN